jgi:hypothetical protein
LKRCILAFLAASTCVASTPSFWELSSFTDFVKGKFDGVSLGRDGVLSLAPRLDTFFNSGQPVIWSVMPGPNGSFYAATGHQGRVFRIDSTGKSTLLWTADKPEVFAIAVDPRRGIVYAATSPDGKIYRIENGKATEYFDPKAKYIWALALAPDGTLYAGTGDGGRIFRITAAGKGEEYYETAQGNVTGLMLDSRGALLAGTDPDGILYRITAKDQAFVLYDSSLPEIRAVAAGPNGSVYAVGLGGSLAKKVSATQTTTGATTDSTPTATTTITVTAATGSEINPTQPTKPQAAAPASETPAVTTASTDTTSTEKSAIYRINADNTVDTLWSSKEENIYDILPSTDGQLYFATDSNGRIYRLTTDRKLTLVAQTSESQTTRLLAGKNGLLAATGNMGKLYTLGSGNTKGAYESPVFDAGSTSKWGKLRWQGTGAVKVRTRAGNSLRPDKTWSPWAETADSQIASPNARFLQFSAELTGAPATIENISAAYLPQNNPPVIHSITVLTTATPVTATPAPSKSPSYSVAVTDTADATPVSSTGTPTQTLSRASSQQIVISWNADDPDSDKLTYELSVRGEGEHDWKTLKKDLTETSFNLDADALADGRYYFQVKASDRASNPAATEKESSLVSSPVLIDNTPPVIRNASASASTLIFEAEDAASILHRAEYSIDAGPWIPVAPVDGILDSRKEAFKVELKDIPKGEHVIVIRVADTGGNTATAKVILR